MKIIKITTPGCSSCVFMTKILESIENIEVVSYDYYDDYEMVQDLNLGRIMPVLIFIDNDIEIKRLVGEHSKKEVLEIINGDIK